MTHDIRPIAPDDAEAWRPLWRAYLEFYETEVDEAVYARTFARLTDPADAGLGGFLAVGAAGPVGLVHYIFHPHCWQIEEVCYLQDLYLAPGARGSGAAEALMRAVYAEADRRGCPNVYWMTQHFNARARRLYDRVGTLTPFLKYRR